MPRDRFLAQAIELAGGPAAVAAAFGISSQAVSQWLRCPAPRTLELARLCEGRITRQQLRPDLYPDEPARAHALSLDSYLRAHRVDAAEFAATLSAQGCRVSRSTISRLRRGGQLPSPELAQAIEEITGGAVTAASLLAPAPERAA
jgi:DNA-binding transcriptional regulator YdaS (Cro superfamily)